MGSIRFELRVTTKGGKPPSGQVKNILSQFGRVFPNMEAACNVARNLSGVDGVREVVVEYINPVVMATWREGSRI